LTLTLLQEPPTGLPLMMTVIVTKQIKTERLFLNTNPINYIFSS
jgi:hypothetical protein